MTAILTATQKEAIRPLNPECRSPLIPAGASRGSMPSKPRSLAEDEGVRVTLHDKDGTVLLEGEMH